MVGRQFGSYTITTELGRGGMGAVYLAEHPIMKKRAAVKVLLPQFSRNAELIARFFNEARAAARLHHPSIVDVYDCGTAPDGAAFMIMEYLDGESLGTRLKDVGRLAWPQVISIGRQIAAAVGVAHTRQIIHRDLKPDNIFLVRSEGGQERVKVLDFGIAKLGATVTESPGPHTRTGVLMGTPLYMSPEQCKGMRELDGRCDIYSLGCLLHAMLVGEPPFLRTGEGELLTAHVYEPVAPLAPKVPDLPPALEAVVLRALAKDPKDRFQSMESLELALGAVAKASPSQARAPVVVKPVEVRRQGTPATAGNTTLSEAAQRSNQVSTRAPRSRGTIWGVALGVVVGAAGVALLAPRVGVDSRAGRTDVEVVVPPPAAVPAAAAAVPSPLPARAERETITLRVVSRPTGARVTYDGAVVGVTPLQLSLPRGTQPVKLLLERRGYLSKTVSITPMTDRQQSVSLLRLREQSPAPVEDPDDGRKL